MVYIDIEKLTIPFDKQLLCRWKERDPEVVPEFAMNWSGNGVKNGYGFGEWLSEAYFRELGFYVINDEYELFSKTS